MSAKAKKFLEGLKTIDDMTVDQARNARRVVNDLIEQSSVTPGANTQVLMDIRNELSSSIEGAVGRLEGINPEAAEALRRANEFHSSNIDKFLSPGIVEAFRPLSDKGFKENSEIFTGLLYGPPERLSRALSIMDVDERRAFSRTAWNHLLARSKPTLAPSGTNTIDPMKLSDMISDMELRDKNVLTQLFDPAGLGVGQSKIDDLKEVLTAAGVKAGKLEFRDGLDLGGNLKKQVADAVQAEQRFAKEFKDNVVGPLIRNEIGVSQVSADDFARHVTSLSTSDVGKIQEKFRLAGREDDLGQIVLNDIFDRAQRAPSIDEIVGQGVDVSRGVLDGVSLSDSIRNIGEEKLAKLIGKEGVEVAKAIATVNIGLGNQAAAQAGGLIVGGLLASLATGLNAAAVSFVGQTRIFTAIVTNQRLGKAIQGATGIKGLRKGDSPEIPTFTILGQIAEDALSATDDPVVSDEIREFFNMNYDMNIQGSFESRRKAVDQFFNIEAQ